ncbi:MAG: hypothetical protein ACE5M4_09130 [Anaerolineales bacterium]
MSDLDLDAVEQWARDNPITKKEEVLVLVKRCRKAEAGKACHECLQIVYPGFVHACLPHPDWVVLRERIAELEGIITSLESWGHTHGKYLCPPSGSADSYGDGMRAAKLEVLSRIRSLLGESDE